MAKRWELPPDAIPLSDREAKVTMKMTDGLTQILMLAGRNLVYLELLSALLTSLTNLDLDPLNNRVDEIMDEFTVSVAKELDLKTHWTFGELMSLALDVLYECMERSLQNEPLTFESIEPSAQE